MDKMNSVIHFHNRSILNSPKNSKCSERTNAIEQLFNTKQCLPNKRYPQCREQKEGFFG